MLQYKYILYENMFVLVLCLFCIWTVNTVSKPEARQTTKMKNVTMMNTLRKLSQTKPAEDETSKEGALNLRNPAPLLLVRVNIQNSQGR